MPKKSPWPASTIEMVDTGTLKPYAQNAKTHSSEQIAQLGKSFDEYGWTSPVLVDEKGEIIAGHGRVMMAVSKGLPQVPVMRAVGWTAAQKKAYRLFDNRSAEMSEWDQTLLRGELKALSSPGLKALPVTGFTKLQTTAILEPPAETRGSRVPSAVISHTLVFDNVEQQQHWHDFMRKLKAGYADRATFAGKFDAFITEQLG